MATLDDVKAALEDAGRQLKADLWHPEDAAFLQARAKDLVGLEAKAAAAPNAGLKSAYVAAARDVVNHVKLLAIVRAEAAARDASDRLGKLFLDKVVPIVVQLLPALLGL